ncbi:uncharacterized protein PGRI_013740 [Penicillium griseofulvum]|uniref:DUF6546 domain-containing protein n=1 Tax=Penicillium patulum TaxID=5078 RepID=A0A135LES4_PENPA|nr:uncharacterized protein PGRI_013740 [Penicillium griseofulvum]KXG47504.1 hypothetical protein PGRI_013740 [Penicillium griseofulvum]
MGFQLPPELTTIVLEYIIGKENANLAPYATINRDWQAIVERRTFERIKINTAKRLAEFNQFPWDQVLWRQRRYHVRKIELIVELESYDGEARTRYENEEEMQRNSNIFTISIQSLFNTLSEWPDNEAGVTLSIRAQSPGDISAQGPEIRKQRGWEPRILADDIWDMRHERSYLQFNEGAVGAQCRAVPIIMYLDIMGAMGHRKLEPASTSLIASKLPRLHDLELCLDDNCKWNPQIRKFRRNDFADSIQLWPPSIGNLSLDFCHLTPEDESFPPAASTVEGTPDPLSWRLREFSQQLKVMGGSQCVLGREFFWPLDGDTPEPPFWPHLTDVSFEYLPITPCGKWMFEKDEDEENYDSDGLGSYYDDMEDTDRDWVAPEDRRCNLFRTKPLHGLFNQHYLSAGKAALRMPKLESMFLDISNRPRYQFRYGVKNGVAKATWFNELDSKAFEPDEEVLQIWKQVALEHTGDDLVVEFDIC